MLSEKKLTKLQQQLKDKPLIEDVIPKFLDGDMKQTALIFAAWLRANKMNPNLVLIDTWQVNYQGKPLCRIRLLHPGWEKVLGKAKWGVHIYRNHIDEYSETVLNGGLQSIIWDNVTPCKNCKGCAPGITVTLFGKTFNNVCNCNMTTWVYDPTEAMIGKIKRLLELEKAARRSLQ